MNRNIFWGGIILPIMLQAQINEAISFQRGLTWTQILSKAKAESKYIFVDCFATWCAPCRQMDSEVYTQEKVGHLVNNKFISVKVQLDSTKHDDQSVVKWREDANNIKIEYNVKVLPTYLFLSPDGRVLHRDVGYKSPDEFIALVSDATNPDKQCYTLLQRYRLGERKYSIMEYLINCANALSEDGRLADSIAQDYIAGFLLQQGDDKLYTNKNIEFIRSYTDDSRDIGFKFLYSNADKVNKAIGRNGFAQSVVSYIISREEIAPLINKNKSAFLDADDWELLESKISRKYGIELASRTILGAKIEYYKSKANWNKYIELLIEKVDRYGVFGDWDIDFNLNNLAWDVFQYSNDRRSLERALIWSDSAVKINPIANWIDTKANILYKLGKTKEAILHQEKAVKIGYRDANAEDYMQNLNKMKRGEPTWPTR